MTNQDCAITVEEAGQMAGEVYGLSANATPLVSYEDQNFRLQSPQGSYILKIANDRWPLEFLEMQNEVLERLSVNSPALPASRLLPSCKGDLMSTFNRRRIRLMTWLEGEVLAKAPRSNALYRGPNNIV